MFTRVISRYGFKDIEFVGLDNFWFVLQDPTFWRSLLITIAYAGVAVPLTLVVGLALSMALNRDLPGRGLLRACFFIPYIVNIEIGRASCRERVWVLVVYASA